MTTAAQPPPERGQAALRRATEKGVTLYQISGTGQWIATSGSQPGIAYATDGTSCGCEAAMLGGDPVCCHRAALRHHLGALPVEPVCQTCGGKKWIEKPSVWGLGGTVKATARPACRSHRARSR